jgi:hypothetical protein
VLQSAKQDAARRTLLQVAKTAMSGGRLQVPDAEQFVCEGLPFEGLGAYVALMQACWVQAPEDRPTFNQNIAELK